MARTRFSGVATARRRPLVLLTFLTCLPPAGMAFAETRAGSASTSVTDGPAGVPADSASESLRLEQAVARSLAANPALVAEEAELRAVQARAEQEGLAPRIVIGAELENVGGTGALTGIDGAETTLRLSRVIERGGKRAARQTLGAAEAARQRHLAAAARLDIASRTAARFISVAAAQQRLTFAQEQATLAERTRGEVARWVMAGRDPESNLRAAEIVVADAELARETAEHELASARLTLAASWGSLRPDFTSVTGDLHELPAVESFETLAARLPQATAQRSAQLEAETVSARRRIAEAGTKQDLDVSLGVRRLEALDDQALVVSVAMPLGGSRRAALATAEAEANLAALESRREAQRIESHQALFERYQELMHARHEYDVLQTTMLPKAEQAFTFTRRGFEAGRFSLVQLAQAQRTLFDLRERSVAAAVRYHTVLVEVERLTAVSSEPTP